MAVAVPFGLPRASTRPEGMLFQRGELRKLLDFARMAEDLGADDIAMSEHVPRVVSRLRGAPA